MRSLVEVPLAGSSIPHVVEGRYGAAHVILLPAAPGAGVIAGMAVRAVCESAGIHDILTTSFGSNNPVSLVKGPIFSRLVGGEDFVHTIDLRDDDAYRRGDPLRRAS